jgi:predicted RNA binding protein YcfA (HicA-like mRNA interferase family)
MNRRDVIKALEKDGWYEVNQVGSHKQFRHAKKRAASRCRTRNGISR